MTAQSDPVANLVAELRDLVEGLADRAQPWFDKLTEGEPGHTPTTCQWCPLCALLAVLRGERSELAVRAAEHAAGLLAVLRTALADHDHDAAPASEPAAERAAAPRVQPIPVRRRAYGPVAEEPELINNPEVSVTPRTGRPRPRRVQRIAVTPTSESAEDQQGS